MSMTNADSYSGGAVAGDALGTVSNVNSQTLTLSLSGAQASLTPLLITAGGNGNNVTGQAYVDLGSYSSIGGFVISQGTGVTNLALQVSNDNNTYQNFAGAAAAGVSTTANPSVGWFAVTGVFRYIRLISNGTQTAGTSQVVLCLKSGTSFANPNQSLAGGTASIGSTNANTSATVLASAARTATTTSSAISNPYSSRAIVTLNVTAASGTGGLQLQLLTVDAISFNTIALNVLPTAITAVGTYAYVIGQGVTTTGLAAGVVAIDVPFPGTYQIKMTHGDASSYTYSVSAMTVNN